MLWPWPGMRRAASSVVRWPHGCLGGLARLATTACSARRLRSSLLYLLVLYCR